MGSDSVWGLRRGNAQIYFNPRSRVGSDTLERSGCLQYCVFQSTLPRGERLWASWASIFFPSQFQSTLPRGERRQTSTDFRQKNQLSAQVCNAFTIKNRAHIKIQVVNTHKYGCEIFRNKCLLILRTKLNHQHAFRLIANFCSKMLNLCLIIFSQIIKPQAVFLFIHNAT